MSTVVLRSPEKWYPTTSVVSLMDVTVNLETVSNSCPNMPNVPAECQTRVEERHDHQFDTVS